MAKKRDYYEILGISKNATAKEIKTAFRNLAKKYHPDINKSHDAEEKMKEVNEAYEVLSDDNKRRTYDQFGHSGMEGMDQHAGYGGFGSFKDIFSGFDGFNMGDIFGDIFSGGNSGYSSRRSTTPMKGNVKSKVISIDFLESVVGTTLNLTVDQYHNCDLCNGKGYEHEEDIEQCKTCSGLGYQNVTTRTFLGSIRQQKICSTCNGDGVTIKKKCEKCKGSQTTKTTSDIKVGIPAGVENGQELLVAGYGGPGRNGGPSGDLVIIIKVNPHKYYVRQGQNIYLDFPVSIADIIQENNVQVPTPYGIKNIKMKSTYKNDQMLTIKDAGVDLKTEKGNLYITLKLVIPNYNKKELKDVRKVISSKEDTINSDFIKNF
ncbi:molecular chaperone DnaJ [Mycoplasma testudineum]|uniref:Chaperone protein DnaJ n=1 Tax=Mycoplasma testudineum TaxID=244584 RepID=A0A4R6IES4_9MOLU|nr:DnaJ C-terminal domain-containing protein [Mycoplasma testudineum]TDO19415.1 molecular chaperone DnaJ [Mycoplasma testudineum]